MRAYLLVFDDSQILRKEIIKIIDQLHQIVNWHAFFGNTMCLTSEVGAKVLARIVNTNLRYLIAEVEPKQKGGRMPNSVLTFLNSPSPVHIEHA